MKRISSILICLALTAGSLMSAFASADIEGHWAEESIRLLMSRGIVNGDANGNINPGAEIKRCEFVKTVNNTFGYTAEASEGYSDVQESEWYYREFLKARNAGYLKGDGNGNANPEAALTRAEGAVILARVMGLDLTAEKSFADEVPAWAVKEVSAMAEKGYIKGYEDGSFRASSPIKRCEVFSIVAEILKDSPEEEKKEENNNGDVSGMTVSANASSGRKPSGGSGGGGSSSGGATYVKLNPPVIKLLENNVLSWTPVSKASGYEIKLTYGDETLNEVVSAEKADLSEYAARLTEASVESSVELLVSVRAIGSGSHKTSEYSEEYVFEYKVFDSENSADLGMKLVFSLSGEGREEYSLEFPEGISLVSIKRADGCENYENPVSPLDITEFVSDESGIIETSYVITARKGDEVQVINTELRYGGGEGTEAAPYLIGSARHFENIALNPSACYLQISDIEISSSGDMTFEGKYDGNGDTQVTFNGEGGKYVSLFGKAKNAEIKNVSLIGNINATDIYAGSVCGYAEKSVIFGCESDVDIVLAGENLKNGAISGGIVGYADAESVISDCAYNGTINSEAGIIGGIAGDSSADISGCENNGDIIATNTVLTGPASYVGGIAGIVRGTARVSGCENNGAVSNHYQSAQDSVTNFISYTGGIVGVAPIVENCVNGKTAVISSLIKSGAPANVSGYQNVGGISGRLETGGVVEGCINEGVVEAPSDSVVFWAGGIVGYSRGSVKSCANYATESRARQYGGIVGRCLGEVSESFNKCPINATGYAGGIAARADAGCVVEYCYNTGDIMSRYAGGFFGSAGSAAVVVRNSYSAPETTCTNAIMAYSLKLNIGDVYYVKKGSETSGANTDAKSVTAAELNSDEVILVLNGSAEAPVFVKGENGYPVLAENPEKGEI